EILVSVIGTLGALGDPRAIEPLLTLVEHGNQTRAAAGAIIQIGEPAVDILVEELDAADQEYRQELLRMLARIPSDTSAHVLIEGLESGRFPRDDVVLAVAQIRDR